MAAEQHPGDPLVSVITIFFNAERFLDEAICSVLDQTYKNFELILVDDGSTDGGPAIARRYAGSHQNVRCVGHPSGANRGMSASRNKGLNEATGALVAFIDADDIWLPQKLAEQVAIMLAHPRVAMLCGCVRYWRSWQGGIDVDIPTGHVQDRLVEPPDASLALYPLGENAAPCPSDMMLRREAVAAVGGFEEHFTGPRQMYEDQGFLAKLYLAYPVYFASRVWLLYRQHEESCVSSVMASGRYREVRTYFLAWFEQYCLRLSPSPGDVTVAVRRALWRCRHPRTSAIAAAGLLIASRARRQFQRIASARARGSDGR